MKLSIIIVSYNTSRLLQVCLSSLYKALIRARLDKESEVIIIDNNSSDDSVNLIKKKFVSVTLVRNEKNLGFTKANNQGIKKSRGRYVLLLNSDTRIFEDTFINLFGIFEKNKNIDVIGCKLLNKDGSIQPSVGYFPTLLKVFFWMTFLDDIPIFSSYVKPYHVGNLKFYTKPQIVDWVTGAFICVKRKVIDRVGLLDEKIFMYGEEVEWCYRIKRAGFNILYSPSVSVYHHKGGSGQGSRSGIIEEFHALLYIYHKHLGNRRTKILRVFLIFGALLRFVLFGIIKGNRRIASLYAKAFKMVG